MRRATRWRRDWRRAGIGEAHHYLDYVRRGFPQYTRLFVLDRTGAIRVSVGREFDLPPPLLHDLAQHAEIHVSAVIGTASRRLQLISAPITSGGRRIGTLFAVLEIASLEAELGAHDLDARTGLYVIGPGSTVLAHSPGAPARITFERAIPKLAAPPSVADYKTPDGAHVVGSALRIERFDWTLAVEQDYDVAFAAALGAMREVLPINLAIVLAFALIALAIARSIVRPIRALSDSAGRIAKGETDIEIAELPGQDEIGVLSRALREMVDRLRRHQVELQRKQDQIERANSDLTRANEELHRSNEILEQLSFTDGLTHLHNHRYFQDRMRLETKRSDRSREPLALLLIDIDHFKALNDQPRSRGGRRGAAPRGDDPEPHRARDRPRRALRRRGVRRARAAHRREGRAPARRAHAPGDRGGAVPRARRRAPDGGVGDRRRSASPPIAAI